jgi:hypothetical protein
MTSPVSRRARPRSVFAAVGADLDALRATPDTSGSSRQGRTTHFTTNYSNGLLNHGPGDIIQLTSNDGWRKSWSIITPGRFTDSSFSDLLFYDQAAGVGEFYTTEGGNLSLLRSYSGWRTSWSVIVPCNLTGGAHQDLLFYDPAGGVGEMYSTDGQGGISLVATYNDWRQTWSMIIPCNITGGSYSDLLFYDPTAGTGEMYKTDGHGGISLIASHTDWRTTWTAIAACRIAGAGRHPSSDLLFYDPSAGVGEMYTVDAQGGISLIASHTDWRHTWSIVKPCGISGHAHSDLMFYDPAAGVGEFYSTDGQGGISLLHTTDNWRHTWSEISPADFTDGAGQDLIFYDPGAGTGEIYTTQGNTLTTAILATCESDYEALRGYFSTTPDDLPFDIYVQSGQGGASHGGCDDSEIQCDAFAGDDDNLLRMLVVSEVDEVFEADQDNGWDCGQSHGEGLSRVLAAHRYPRSMTVPGVSFRTGGWWIWSDRQNWVEQNEDSDKHFPSIGCATLFIHYLKSQLGYSYEQITQAGGGTLAETFHRLSGRTDAFAPFKAAVERRFDVALLEPFDSDNAFPIYRDLLFYDPTAGTGEFYTSDISGGITFLAAGNTWRNSWSIITPGNFTSRSYDDLLFYDPAAGTGEIYQSDGQGHIELVASHTDWRTTWDIIRLARFGGQRYDGILFYDRDSGTGEIYSTDGQGSIQQMASYTDWRTTWRTILVGNFTRNRYPDLLFYDPQAGLIEIYSTDDGGNIALAGRTANMSNTWDIGLACNVTGGEFSDVMFYDRAQGLIEFFTTFGDGTLTTLSGPKTIGGNWSEVHYTAFREFLFYDPNQGVGEYHRVTDTGDPSLLNRYTDWRHTWSVIAPGTYS